MGRHKDVSTGWAGILQANALSQPYNTAAFNSYAGTESVSSGLFASTGGTTDILDWVLVELRDASTPTTVKARRAAFIREDGQIVDLDGVSDVTFPNTEASNYYVVIRHRNHLSVRSATALALSSTTTSYDFTTDQSKAYQDGSITTNAAMKDLSGVGTGPYALWGGNANGNTAVRASGPNGTLNDWLYLSNNVLLGNVATVIGSAYNSADVNLDGSVRASGPNGNLNDWLNLSNTLSGNVGTVITAHQ